jgi:serine/threonine protein kinase
MPIPVGTRIGPYEILAPLGAGGMGEVYRARDAKLDREVAIKVLPQSLARDPERIARFEREAKVLAALNHPNIAQIYGLAEADGLRALVMELVPGKPLQGPLPLKEALNIARQIAEALQAAHDKGITHRDLKPANIMVTPDGTVKVLDFGLAKLAERASAGEGDPSQSPTLTIGGTEAGMIMGTAAYMAPEQARGQAVDRRADIWAFGVVLYELLTGKRLFEGETVSDILAAVLKVEPDLSAAPAKVRPLLERCLQKDPKKRLQAVGDWELLLEDRPEGAVRTSRLPWAVAAAVAVVSVGLGLVAFRHVTEEPPRVLKSSVLPPERATFKADSLPALSPDGRTLAFVATVDGNDELWVRELDSLNARALPGTDGAYDPFWSPDSRSLAFFTAGKLKRIDIAGGPALTLSSVTTESARGGSWSKDDVIVFAPGTNTGLFLVSAAGGDARAATTIDRSHGEVSHRFPWFLPDGRHFLYTAASNDSEKTAIYVGDAQSGAKRKVLNAGSNAVYAPPGYLLFVRDETLMAQSFDAADPKTTADAVPIAESIGYIQASGQGQFSASLNGVLAYTSVGATSIFENQLTWFDRTGKPTGTLGTAGPVLWPAISPDGKTVASYRADPQTGYSDLWVYDLTRSSTSRFTFGPTTNMYPVWSPNGSRIAFRSTRDGGSSLYQKATNGTAHEELLDKSAPNLQRPEDWSRDGRYLILGRAGNPKSGFDVWVYPFFGNRKPFPYLQSTFNEMYPRLSPDGRWLAYTSDETKRQEVYVVTFPEPGGKWQVSTNGGSKAVWSKEGKELYSISADGKMMAAEVKGGERFEVSVPKPLFDVHIGNTTNDIYEVSKDGRFLIPVPVDRSSGAAMTVVVNWTAGLKK